MDVLAMWFLYGLSTSVTKNIHFCFGVTCPFLHDLYSPCSGRIEGGILEVVISNEEKIKPKKFLFFYSVFFHEKKTWFFERKKIHCKSFLFFHGLFFREKK